MMATKRLLKKRRAAWKTVLRLPGSRSGQVCGIKQPQFRRCSGWVLAHHGRIYRMVLLGAPVVVGLMTGIGIEPKS